jgi:hypothetical protein
VRARQSPISRRISCRTRCQGRACKRRAHTGATPGVTHTASTTVCTIGPGLVAARCLNARHAAEQDWMLSNPGVDVDQILALLCRS